MNLKEINNIFKAHLQWQSQRINFLLLFIVSLIKVKTLNLAEVAQGFDTDAKIESNYRRIQRFFETMEVCNKQIARLISHFLPDGKWILCLDRTEWKFGKSYINILFLAVAHKTFSIPLFWKVLDYRGSTDLFLKKLLIMNFIEVFGKNKIEYITADREFGAINYFEWLECQKIRFVIRIKDNFTFMNQKGESVPARNFFRTLCPKKLVKYKKGLMLNLVGRIHEKEYLIVASNFNAELKHYRVRWQIENMFSAFKTRGFNLEDTKLTEPKKLEKLISLLALAFCWAIAVGEWVTEQNPLKYRTDIEAFTKSLFKTGFENIRQALINSIKAHLIQGFFRILLRYFIPYNKIVVE